MTDIRTFSLRSAAALTLAALPLAAVGQMHKVATPDKVTRAVGVYEYIGDPLKPKAARLIPVSLFIGGHFEDAGVYLARPIPLALDTGNRYELQKSGVPKDLLDLVAARNFAGSEVAANLPFEDGWFGYGHASAPKAAPAGRVRPNCGNARVVDDTPKKDDGKPHFGSTPAPADAKAAAAAIPAECRDEAQPEKVTLDDYRSKDKDAADPERPTLHRSPESSAHNTGAEGKADKKDAKKPPEATVTQNGGPGDDPDRPMIRHRAADEEDANALPPDPLEYAKKPAATADSSQPPGPADARSTSNSTVADGGNITAGDTMSGGPVLRRGKLTAPAKDDIAAVVKPSTPGVPMPGATMPAPLEAMVAVSDPKDRPQHDFAYSFGSSSERAVAVTALEEMARAVVMKPSLATDAMEGSAAAAPAPAAKVPAATRPRTAAGVRSAAAPRKAAPTPAALAQITLADEEMRAYQLYFSAPVSYTFFARVPASGTQPERYVTVVATTDAEGKLMPAMRTVTDSAHLDRIPRYRPIDVVDADGSNRASILMEVRAQRSRQFALYRLLGNRPDQIFVSGSTLL